MRLVPFICLAILVCSSCSKKLLTFGAIGEDKSLFYYHKGQGDPIIFVHGGPGMNHRYFLPYMERLADKNHLIFYDQKACGDSEAPADTNAMRIHEFVADLDKIKNKFHLKKFHLLAHSWGANLALRYAIKNQSNLSSLILVNPAATSYSDVREASKLLNMRFNPMDQNVRNQIISSEAFRLGDPSAVAALMKLSFSKNMARPELADSIQIYIPMDQNKKSNALRYLFKDLADYDLYESAASIKVPTLIISGDSEVGLEQNKKLADKIKSSQLHIISKSGHFPFIENPGEFDKVIKEFFKK